MSFFLPYNWITGKELQTLLKSDRRPRIVDVRDDDYIGGHIAGAINYPSTKFLNDTHVLVRELKDEPVVVFHCALSQSRGPKAARIYAEARKVSFPDAPEQKIVVLRGGFVQFQAEFRDDPTLFEDYRPELWNR